LIRHRDCTKKPRRVGPGGAEKLVVASGGFPEIFLLRANFPIGQSLGDSRRPVDDRKVPAVRPTPFRDHPLRGKSFFTFNAASSADARCAALLTLTLVRKSRAGLAKFRLLTHSGLRSILWLLAKRARQMCSNRVRLEPKVVALSTSGHG
jgi:hypothetical protein